MKKLILMRHAKAEKAVGIPDFERTLTERGKSDAKAMSLEILKDKDLPSLIVASPTFRTKKTAEIVASELQIKHNHICFDHDLIDAGLHDLLSMIRSLDDKEDCVMFVGHNPLMTSCVGYLAKEFLEHMPTAGYVTIAFNVSSWKIVQEQHGKLVTFKHPKSNEA